MTFNIKTLPYEPQLLTDTLSGKLEWQSCEFLPPRVNVEEGIMSYLVVIRKIKVKSMSCLWCLYPHKTTGDYTIFVNVNDGAHIFLCSIITGIHFVDSWNRIRQLEESFRIIDAPLEDILQIQQALEP